MRKRNVTMNVHPSFHEYIEEERKAFMKKHGLYKLSTKAFTGILINKKWIKNKNVKFK